MPPTWLRSAFFLLSLSIVACGPGHDKGTDGGGGGDGGTPDATLAIGPGDLTLTMVDGVPVQQAYSATLHFPDGTTRDVTTDAVYSVNDGTLGTFSNELFTTSGTVGGVTAVTASYMGLQDSAQLTVDVKNHRVVSGAPSDAPGWFDTATDDPTLAPALAYPNDGTLVPPNLGDFEVHWVDSGGADLFEVALVGAHVDLRLYVPGSPNAGNWVAYLPAEWSIAGLSERAGTLSVSVRGMVRADPTKAGASSTISVGLSEEDVIGGIYYWASKADGGASAGIYRHDMSHPGDPAEEFYTTAQSPDNRCVACHVLSRDGTKMAITYDGGDGAASIVDVGTRTEMLATDGTFHWNFAAYEPNGNRIVTVYQGVMKLRQASDGADLGTVATGGWATHPDFSPTGDKLAFVQVGSPAADWHFDAGSIAVMSFDASTGAFGAPQVLVPGSVGVNNYYPSWSPDGKWLMFNRSSEDAYDDGTAELWVVKGDGSVGPTKIDSANVGTGLTNSWPRWTPFVESLSGETMYWFTFSSKRAFGVRLADGARPQIWMAPFFPDRIDAGMDPSRPAFRLPAQNITSNNHIAQWTEQVVPIN